jgi:DNA primase
MELMKGWAKLREQLDIVDVIQSYLPLKQNEQAYMGICPFHRGRDWSLSVSASKQLYSCSRCGHSGDVIHFVKSIEGITWKDAVERLAQQAGFVFTEINHDPHLERIREALNLAAKLFHHTLLAMPYGQPGREYLRKRGIRSETIDTFQIGYAPNSFQFALPFLRRRGFSEQEIEQAGLIGRSAKGRAYDRFRHRVIFPIHDQKGQIIGFNGRLVAGGGPKYLNSPESPLYQKRAYLFNLHRAQGTIEQKQQALLFEGTMDVLSAWQAGMKQGVATLGTALTEIQVKRLKRHTRQVILCYDADEAGVNASQKAVEVLHSKQCTVRVTRMPEGTDPDTYIQQHGTEAFQQNILAQAQSVIAFQLWCAKQQVNWQDEDERLAYAQRALTILATYASKQEQEAYLETIATECQLSVSVLKSELQKYRQKRERRRYSWKRLPKRQNSPGQDPLYAAERYLLAQMMRSSAVTHRVQEQLGTEFHLDIHERLAAQLYGFYAQETVGGMDDFLQTLQETDLLTLAQQLAMRQVAEPSVQELQQSIERIRQIPLEQEIAAKEQQIKALDKLDPVRAAKLNQEITALKKQLKF